MPTDKCWICGEEANSGEHYIKASDLFSIFGKVTCKRPLYTRKDGKPIKIPGIKSAKLKYKVKLCSNCNNNLSIRYDKAWETLSLYLRERRPEVVNDSVINLERVFPGAIKKFMLYVHLYFLKQFGCMIREHNAPIDTDEISSCLRNCVAHPRVWLTICVAVGDEVRRADRAPLIYPVEGSDIFVNWFYRIGNVVVLLAYSPVVEFSCLENAWHPSFIGKKIKIRLLGQS